MNTASLAHLPGLLRVSGGDEEAAQGGDPETPQFQPRGRTSAKGRPRPSLGCRFRASKA